MEANTNNRVQVFCRLRPLKHECEPPCIKLISTTTLTAFSESKLGRKECNYVFRHIFTSYASQREVFEHVTLPLLEDLVNGHKGLLFTYGVTGSGKTYTLTGQPSMPGILPRCIDTLFNSIGEIQTQKFLIKSDRMNGFELQTENEALEERLAATKTNSKRLQIGKRAGDYKNMYVNDEMKLSTVDETCCYAVFISYVEIYNNTVYDLLDDSNGKNLQAKIIREDSQKNMYINAVVEMEVKSASEAFELFCMGIKRKRMAYTQLNAESSRSHSIFNIKVVQLNESRDQFKIGQLSLVDLAGSERSNRTNNTGIRLKEASSINNSLMTLRTCLALLRENQETRASKLVPYRDSRLTLLFKNYFEGDGHVRMIVCINPSSQDCEENLQVLKFAELSQDVKVSRTELLYTPHRKTPKPKTPLTTKLKRNVKLTFGSKLPLISLNMSNYAENLLIIDNLTKHLSTRKQKIEAHQKEIEQNEEHLRKRLIQMHQERVLTESDIRSLKAMWKKEKQSCQNLKRKIVDLETDKTNLTAENDKLEEYIQALQKSIEEKNLKINQNFLRGEKTKQQFVLHTQKMNQELDEKLRRQRERIQAEMQAKDIKLAKVKQIIDSETVSLASEETPRAPLVEIEPTQTIGVDYNKEQMLGVTPRRLRGRMGGEVWLEHNAVKPITLGTVMQPTMKKRKSVSKLKKARDVTNPKQNKYCLIAQEPDIAGELETKVYKADILPTCGGGAQVVFNDVERLKQESPTAASTIPFHK